MNRSKLYDGLSEIERDQVTLYVKRINEHAVIFDTPVYKSFALGVEYQDLKNKVSNGDISYKAYLRLCMYIIDWASNICRENLGLN